MTNEQLLLSTVGTSDYEPTRFVLDGVGEHKTSTSPVALARLLDVDSVLLAHTTAVREQTQHLDRLEAVFDGSERRIEFVEVPLIDGRSEIDEVLDALLTAIDRLDPSGLVLDTSHAYRSLQMTFYSSVLQLSALDLVAIDGIYYAEDAGGGDTANVVDLTYLHTLIEWYHALRSFEVAGTLSHIQQLLESRRNRVYRQGEKHPELAELEGSIAGVSAYLDSGLPLETGATARDAVSTLQSLDDSDFIGPEGTFLDPLEEQLQQFAMQQPVGQTEKESVQLTMTELKRQRNQVWFYAERHRHWIALECARELFVNRLLYEQYGSDVDWLDTEIRIDSRTVLTDQSGKRQEEDPGESPAAIRVWDRLSQYRNMHAHAGFDPNTTPTGSDVREAIEAVCDSITDDEFWRELL